VGIRGDSVLVPWRPFFWNDAEVVVRTGVFQWGHGPSHHPEWQVQRALSGHARYRGRGTAAELVLLLTN